MSTVVLQAKISGSFTSVCENHTLRKIFFNLTNIVLYYTLDYNTHLRYCCRKTTVFNEDQLLDFSVLELVRSQSAFSTDPEILQNCAGFTLCSSTSLAVGECSAVMGLTLCMLCV